MWFYQNTECVNSVLTDWLDLLLKCRFYGCKGNKLREASEQQQFNRNIEDVDIWLHEIESQLASEDYGKVSGEPTQCCSLLSAVCV